MMFGSIVAVIVAGAINVGPISEAFRIAGEGDRLHLFEMSPGKDCSKGPWPCCGPQLWGPAVGLMKVRMRFQLVDVIKKEDWFSLVYCTLVQ